MNELVARPRLNISNRIRDEIKAPIDRFLADENASIDSPVINEAFYSLNMISKIQEREDISTITDNKAIADILYDAENAESMLKSYTNDELYILTSTVGKFMDTPGMITFDNVKWLRNISYMLNREDMVRLSNFQITLSCDSR